MKEKIPRFDFEMAPLSCQDKGHRAKINNYNQIKEPGWKVEFFFKDILNTSLNGKRNSLTNFPNIKLCWFLSISRIHVEKRLKCFHINQFQLDKLLLLVCAFLWKKSRVKETVIYDWA